MGVLCEYSGGMCRKSEVRTGVARGAKRGPARSGGGSGEERGQRRRAGARAQAGEQGSCLLGTRKRSPADHSSPTHASNGSARLTRKRPIEVFTNGVRGLGRRSGIEKGGVVSGRVQARLGMRPCSEGRVGERGVGWRDGDERSASCDTNSPLSSYHTMGRYASGMPPCSTRRDSVAVRRSICFAGGSSPVAWRRGADGEGRRVAARRGGGRAHVHCRADEVHTRHPVAEATSRAAPARPHDRLGGAPPPRAPAA